MGDLSVVIEDESNMINLWDFARNPAGFLSDEKGSVIRADVLGEDYAIQYVPRSGGEPDSYHSYRPTGGVFDGRVSASVRRDGDFAVGARGNYFFRETEFKTRKSELEYPDILLVVSKSLNSLVSVGANLEYFEYNSEWHSKDTPARSHYDTKYLLAEVGVQREFSREMTLAVLLSYDNIDSDFSYPQVNYHTYRAAAQGIVDIDERLTIGLETVFNIRRANFRYSHAGNENYYFTHFKLRGVYRLTSRLRAGLFFSHRELFSRSGYPFDDFIFPVPLDAYAVGHWGIGCSYAFDKNIIVGLEYHFRNSSELHGNFLDVGLMHSSLNVGVEGELSQALSLRGGYVWMGTDRNPLEYPRAEARTRENALTVGFGYGPQESNLIIDISYRYAFKKFEYWSANWDLEAQGHLLSLSFKMAL